MTTELHTRPPARPIRPATLVLLLLCSAGGIYAGMRWHTTFERWLAPSAGAATGSASEGQAAKPTEGKKQLWTCGMHPQVIQDHPGDCPICHMKLTPLVTNDAGGGGSFRGTPEPAGAAVVIDPAVVQNMGVRTVVVAEGPLRQRIRATATVTEPESGRRDINLRVSGWIQTLYANTDGMPVKKGDPLFDLYSPELQQAIEELISARKAASGADERSTAGLAASSAGLLSAAETRLTTLGLTPEQVSHLGAMEHAPAVVTFLSPIDGHVFDKAGLYNGSAVSAGQMVLRLADRSTMWVEARIPEGSIARIRTGQRATAKADAFAGRTYEGEVVFIHPHLDEVTRTALVRMSMPNIDGKLLLGMYATVDIDVGSTEPAVLVPREAIIDSGESQLVFVSTGRGRFEPRRIVMGQAGEQGLVQILNGLKPGETVVASGQFLLDSESRLREAIAKFLSQGGASSAVPESTPRSTATPPLPIAPAVQGRVDAVVNAYLPMAEALGAIQKDDTPLTPNDLIAAIRALHAEVMGPDPVRLASEAAAAAESLKGQPIDKQRELFMTVSASVIAIVEVLPPSPPLAASLYVVNCPMAKADWLQRKTEIANPYYAEDMKECGSVVRSLGGPKGAR